jgi:hypothetical protein
MNKKMFHKILLISAFFITSATSNQILVKVDDPIQQEELSRKQDFMIIKSAIIEKLSNNFRNIKFDQGDLNWEVRMEGNLDFVSQFFNPYKDPEVGKRFFKKADLMKFINYKINYHRDWGRYVGFFIQKGYDKEYAKDITYSKKSFQERVYEFLGYQQKEQAKWQNILLQVKQAPSDYLLSAIKHPHEITGVDKLHSIGLDGEGASVIVWDCGFLPNKHLNYKINVRYMNEDEDSDEEEMKDSTSDYMMIDHMSDFMDEKDSEKLKSEGRFYDPNKQHGTHVSGIISASKKAGNCKGIACGAEVLPIVYEGIPDLIERIKNDKSRVISASFSFLLNRAEIHELKMLAEELEKNDRLLVIASGNESKYLSHEMMPKFSEFWGRGMWMCRNFPVAFEKNPDLSKRIILVGSLKNDGTTVSRFSNLPGELSQHFIFAPGEDVKSTVGGDRMMKMSGTSMATPHVSGIIVLLTKAFPNLSMVEIKDCILKSGDPFWQESGKFQMEYNPLVHGNGRVNAVKAFDLAKKLSEQKENDLSI